MANADQTLNLTIQQSADLEIAKSGQQIAEAKRLCEVLTELKSRREAAFNGGDDVEVYDQAIKNLGGSTESLADHSQALSQVFGQLDQILPGLGASAQFVAGAFKAEGEAATGAAEANAAFNETAGVIAVIALAIQAASTYWDMYQKSGQAALEAQTTAAKGLDDITKKMVQEQADFNQAMSDGLEPAAAIEKSLTSQQRKLEAQITAQKNLLKAREEAELADAKTPAQTAAIKKKYALLGEAQEDSGEDQKTSLQQKAQADAQKQMADLEKERDEVRQHGLNLLKPKHERKWVKPARGVKGHWGEEVDTDPTDADLGAVKADLPKIEALDKQIKDLNTLAKSLGDTIAENQTIGGINKQGRTAVDNTGDLNADLQNAFRINDRGPQNQDQQNFIQRLAVLSAGHTMNLQQAEAYLAQLEQHPEVMGRVLDRLLKLNGQTITQINTWSAEITALEAKLQNVQSTGAR